METAQDPEPKRLGNTNASSSAIILGSNPWGDAAWQLCLSRIELGDVTPHNIKQLKRLNQVIFPVSYNDKFYKDVLEVGELAKLAYFNDIAVGAVCCRVDHSQNQKRLYIMTLGCLAPYRRLGIGTKMLNHVLNICEKDGTFDNIYLHVQISNESAIDFYRKFGFEIIETKKNYYKRIEPADAHVLQKNLKVPSLGQNADVQKTDN
uniref:N-alpha-acetyltransferase 50 n=1 Tax=Monodelphis domestica TaxID=13616 RepID=A0A5F8H942_MONDO